MPIEAILRGGGVSQRPVSPSIVCASSPNGASVAIERLLEVAAVLLHVLPVAGQVEDRVADELSGRVVGRLAAAVGLDELDLRAVGQVQLALVGAPAERDDGRMLQEQHRVGQLAGGDARRERALELPGLEVRRHAEVQEEGGPGHRTSVPASDEAELVRADHRFEPRVHLEPGQDAAHVVANRRLGDPERLRDAVRGVARRQMP